MGYRENIKLTLQTKIMLLIIVVVSIAILNTGVYIAKWRISDIRKETDTNIMNIANIIANAPVVRQNLGKINNQKLIEDYVNKILASTQHVEVVVVVDMNNIRYAHPNKEKILKRFVGGDEGRVLKNAESYISEAEGTLGKEIRAFVPVFNYNNQQVGFVMVGKLIESFKKNVQQSLNNIIISSFFGLLLGIMGAFILARSIKKTLLGLEPEEISNLYIQRQSMLEAMNEGIIAIDEKSNIILVNNSAIKMLKLKDNIIGKNIIEVFPDCKLIEILKSGDTEYNKEQLINDTIVLINRVPLKDGQKIMGALATFSDKTMVTRLAEEITGVNQIVDALRANTHEFMNKLHVILGLIDMEEINEAKKFIINETEKHQEIISNVMKLIKDPTIAGLLLGKISRAKELGIKMNIEKESYLEKRIGRINSSVLVTILGNLIENALEAVNKNELDEKLISVLIKENSKEIIIKVKDNGVGIAEENINKIFEKGFTTKDGNRGRGLSLVSEVIENLNGFVNVESNKATGTIFEVLIPKGDI